MAGEADAEHVEDLALHPVGPRPERDGRGERRVGVVDAGLDDQALGRVQVPQHVVDLEPGPGPAGIAQVVGRPQLGEQVEAALALQRPSAARSAATAARTGAGCRGIATS